ncbi:MAG: glycosyltransferase family 4 protein [bacterium]
MRILIVNNNFSSEFGGKAGGAERYVLDVVEGLKSKGHKVYTSTGTEHLEKAEVVFVNNCFNTTLLKEITQKPAVRFVHDHQVYCPGTPKYWFHSQKQCCINTSWRCLYYALCEQCLSRNPARAVPAVLAKPKELAVNRKFKKILVASEFMRQMLLENGFAKEQVEINHLFPYGEFVSNLRGQENLPNDKPLILYAGRIFKEKGVDQLIRAVALLKQDFRLVICGAGWDKERCARIVKELGLDSRVTFAGSVPQKELLEYYQQAEVVVVPSVWPEPFGLIGIEAYQYGKPVVGFDSGGISEWLKNGKNGFLVEGLNISQMAQKIDLLLKDKDLAQKMGQAGKAMVAEEFTFKGHIKRLEEVFETVINENN